MRAGAGAVTRPHLPVPCLRQACLSCLQTPQRCCLPALLPHGDVHPGTSYSGSEQTQSRSRSACPAHPVLGLQSRADGTMVVNPTGGPEPCPPQLCCHSPKQLVRAIPVRCQHQVVLCQPAAVMALTEGRALTFLPPVHTEPAPRCPRTPAGQGLALLWPWLWVQFQAYGCNPKHRGTKTCTGLWCIVPRMEALRKGLQLQPT